MDEQLTDRDSQRLPRDKKELLERIQSLRSRLEQNISQLSDFQLAAPGMTSDWSVKDHLAHLAVWEDSLAALLRREPRHSAMKVDETTYLRGADAINEMIYQRNKERSLGEVLAHFRKSHQQALAALDGLTNADLFRTYSHYQPDEPGEDSGEPILAWVAGNTYEHYAEHYALIQAVSE